MGSFEGADVVGHYNAASLISLMRGGEPSKAITSLYLAERPRDCAQTHLSWRPRHFFLANCAALILSPPGTERFSLGRELVGEVRQDHLR